MAVIKTLACDFKNLCFIDNFKTFNIHVNHSNSSIIFCHSYQVTLRFIFHSKFARLSCSASSHLIGALHSLHLKFHLWNLRLSVEAEHRGAAAQPLVPMVRTTQRTQSLPVLEHAWVSPVPQEAACQGSCKSFS